jgi:hypothetical protein
MSYSYYNKEFCSLFNISPSRLYSNKYILKRIIKFSNETFKVVDKDFYVFSSKITTYFNKFIKHPSFNYIELYLLVDKIKIKLNNYKIVSSKKSDIIIKELYIEL